MQIARNEIDRCLKWYLKQPECERVAISDEQVRIFRLTLNKKRKAGESVVVNGEVNYQAFCEALFRRYRLHYGKQDNRHDLKEIEEIRVNLARDTRKPKSSKVRDKISTDLYLTIKTLRKEGLSWAKVSAYIAKYHKRKISSGYLHRIFTEIEHGITETIDCEEEPG